MSKPEKCQNCDHPSYRHNWSTNSGQRICLNFLCDCETYVGKEDLTKSPLFAKLDRMLEIRPSVPSIRGMDTLGRPLVDHMMLYGKPVSVTQIEKTLIMIRNVVDDEAGWQLAASQLQGKLVDILVRMNVPRSGNVVESPKVVLPKVNLTDSYIRTRCLNCPHKGVAHLDTYTESGYGACHHGSGCKCVDFTPSDIKEGDEVVFRDAAHKMATDMSAELNARVESGSLFYNHEYFKERFMKEEKTGLENDPVNHPSHYTAYKGIEVIDLTRQMNFNRGNAVKYIARAGLKSKETEQQDLEKAIWYLTDELKQLRGEV